MERGEGAIPPIVAGSATPCPRAASQGKAHVHVEPAQRAQDVVQKGLEWQTGGRSHLSMRGQVTMDKDGRAAWPRWRLKAGRGGLRATLPAPLPKKGGR